MRPHWGEVCFLLRLLVWRSLGYDDDGLELYFTNPDTKEFVHQSQDQGLSIFERSMNEAEPLPRGHTKEYKTDLCDKLKQLINSRLLKKPKTIIVLTDGLWEGNPSEDGIREIIELKMRLKAGVSRPDVERTSSQLERLTALSKTRPFTIQFISFGHEQQGLQRMAAPDDGIKGCP